MDLARRGVDVKFVEPRRFGNITVEDVERVMTDRTRLVSLASVHFQSGWRLDVNRIGKFLRECMERNVKEICLTGTNTDPLLYTRTFELQDYIRYIIPGVSLALRTNGIASGLSVREARKAAATYTAAP